MLRIRVGGEALKLYRALWEDFKINYKSSFINSLIVFIAITISVYYGCIWNKQDAAEITKNISAQFGDKLKLTNDWAIFFMLIKNNALACVQILLISLLPIPFLYYITLVINAMMIGLVMYLADVANENVLKEMITGILPHGFIEISMFLLCICMAGK